VLIRGATLPDGRPADVRVGPTSIVEMAERLGPPDADEDVVEADGGVVIPGLHDHHIHLLATAAAEVSVQVGPPEVTTPSGLAAALRAAARGWPPGEWLRGVGYHDSVAGPLDRRYLDSLVGDRPVRVQHRSGQLWILNSAALDALGPIPDRPDGMEVDGSLSPTGRLWRLDGWLGLRLPFPPIDLAGLSRVAASWGVTGFTDATPSRAGQIQALTEASENGLIVQMLHLMTEPGVAVPATDRKVTAGPIKVLLDDDRLPALDDLVAVIHDSNRQGRPVAIHCVTRVQAVLAVAAFEDARASPGDRIEHAAVMDLALADTVRRLGITLVTQPAFIRTRGDQYLRDVDPDDLPDLWRLGTLIDSGVGIAAGTDAPFGPGDPWLSVGCATDRTTSGGVVLGPGERVALAEAVALFTGHVDRPATRRRVAVGEPPEVCVLANPPTARTAPHILATVVAGEVVFRSD
jgi:predicted amidohydrolase YtcJ